MSKYRFFIFSVFLLIFGCSHSEPANQSDSANQNAAEIKNQPQNFDERAVKLIKIKDSVAPFFTLMGKPQEHDWLASFKESGQTFEEYLNSNPTLPDAKRRIIYIQPTGDFSAKQKKILDLTAQYMKAFYNLPVKLNPVIKLENVPEEMRRKNPYDGQKQIKTEYFLDIF